MCLKCNSLSDMLSYSNGTIGVAVSFQLCHLPNDLSMQTAGCDQDLQEILELFCCFDVCVV